MKTVAGGVSRWADAIPGRGRRADVHGRTVLVTGSSRGLGLALAEEFARRGARVAMCGRDATTLESARHRVGRLGGEVLAEVCDVGDRHQVDDLMRTITSTFGPLDVLVNNAGVITVAPLQVQSTEDFEQAMDVMFWGVVHPTLAALPAMLEHGRGHIVNITSIGGKVSSPHLLPYNCAKFAAVAFSDGVQAEVARRGIHVLTVVPGFMRTGSQEHARFGGRPDAEFRWFTVAGNLPVTSMRADRAARRIVDASLRGRRQLLVGPQAQVVGRLAALFPGLSAAVLNGFSRLLPPPDGDGRREGAASDHSALPRLLAAMEQRAARALNQTPAGPARHRTEGALDDLPAKEVSMDEGRIEIPKRAHDQPAEGGREQAEEALGHEETEERPEADREAPPRAGLETTPTEESGGRPLGG